jgi:phenylpropionate dioxygenase-like ring-hydroxylating dioxygenase large terminal subunit
MIPQNKVDASEPLLGFWYAARLSADVPRGQMKAQSLLGYPLLLCRGTDGRVAALKDLCPHRGMPLSFGRFDGERVECAYHGWQFDRGGTCRAIPALVERSPIKPEKICITSYPCQEQDGYIWVYIPDGSTIPSPLPPVPTLPVRSESYHLLHVETSLSCTVDNGVVGLLDPAHGAFVHHNSWWRTPKSIHEKAKHYEPLPTGFRMTPHTPSKNSSPYQFLGQAGSPVLTTIDFYLPNIRVELIQSGDRWFLSRAMITPITKDTCRMDFCAAWNVFRWIPFSKTIFRYFAVTFLNQDKLAMERQSVGLRYHPPMMLIDDADTPSRWYLRLKAAHLAAKQTGGVLDHPLKSPVTLRWRT